MSVTILFLLLSSLLLFVHPAKANNQTASTMSLLTSTRGVSYQAERISLGSQGANKTTQMYVFCNRSETPIWLRRTQFTSPGAQAGWDSYLAGETCSVLMLNRKSMVFSCDRADQDQLAMLNCKDYVAAARIAKQDDTFSDTYVGDYWVVESLPSEQLLEALQNKKLLV